MAAHYSYPAASEACGSAGGWHPWWQHNKLFSDDVQRFDVELYVVDTVSKNSFPGGGADGCCGLMCVGSLQ